MMVEGAKTKINLQIAFAGEADANRRYTAYGIRALHEGYPEIAQLFFEAAGAETVHAYSHLVALDAIGTTVENLRRAARGETGEIEQVYPRMIAEAEAEGAQQAAASFRLALEREKHHQQMFRRALAALEERGMRPERDGAPAFSAGSPSSYSPGRDSQRQPEDSRLGTGTQDVRGKGALTPEALASAFLRGQAGSETAGAKGVSGHRGGTGAAVNRATVKRGLKEIEGERERIARLAGIREVVFGGQDGLLSTATLVAGIAATTAQRTVVLVAGAIAAIAGALSMAVGAYLASRAQRQVYEAELASERREIAEKPGEELAELLAALIGRGLPRRDAIEIVRRTSGHPRLLLEMLSAFELGLTSENLGSPSRDAMVMGIAFMAGSAIPLLPFLVLGVKPGLVAAMLLALGALFALGAVKARLSGRPALPSGLEVMLLGGTVGTLAYALGRLVSSMFDIHI